MQLMVAIRDFRFSGADLTAGETFFARDGMARSLIALGRAEIAPERVSAHVYGRRDMQSAPAPITVSVTDDLRSRYETKFSKKPDGRWKDARLRAELDKD